MSFFEFAYCALQIWLFVVIASCLWQEKKLKVPPAPTLPWVKKQALALLRQHADAGRVHRIAELGCGWGGVLFSLARIFPQARITGYEISFWPYWISRFRTLSKRPRIDIKKQDFFTVDMEPYDIVFCYLTTWHTERLKPQLEKLKPGSLIVCCSYPVPGWDPVEVRTLGRWIKIPVFLYLAK